MISGRAVLLLSIAALSGCGSGESDVLDDFCSPPSISSSPPTAASAEQQYTYFVDSSYQCAILPISFPCRGVVGVTLPAGAVVGFDHVRWTPSVSHANTTVPFQIATQTDFCGRRATQSWTVRVAPSAIQSFSAAKALVAYGESTTLTAVFVGSGEISGLGAITSGVPRNTGAITSNRTFTLVVSNGSGGQWRRSLTVGVLPTVVSTSPEDGAPAAAVNRALTATFSRLMDGATITPATFLLKDSGDNPVAGAVTYANGVATFAPAAPLMGFSLYSAVVTTGARDIAGNPLAADYAWTFTTGAPDTTRPTVISTAPATGGTVAPENVRLLATFSESIYPSSINAGTFILRDGALNPVSGLVSIVNGGTAVEFRVAALAPMSPYTATLSAGIEDLAGNTLGVDHSWTFTTRAHSWQPTSMAGAPSARYAHTAVWTGSEMIVWGGWDGSATLDSGAKYDPATDIWTPISTTGTPSARTNHTAVWTGAEMIVWGGLSVSGKVMSGARYDPVTDSWAPISETNAPTARYGHSAVWTGSEMIVWGGYNGEGGNLATSWPVSGARYDPLTDTWQPLNTSGAPAGRWIHTAVWTGSEMIVWGGSSGLFGGFQDSGARYNPATDTWTPTSMTDAPSPRYQHTAVWTGTEMIVWGGNGTASGGRYNPATDLWTSISDVGKPGVMTNHSAVWTGSEMIVWGSSTFTNARYDPVSDVWTPVATTGTPSPRTNHTSVWTGSEMIVWGGGTPPNSSSPLFNTGGRYLP